MGDLEVVSSMISDLSIAFYWASMLVGIGILSFPILWVLAKRLPDGGFGVSTAFGVALLSFLVWVGSSLRLFPFSLASSVVCLVVVATLSFLIAWKNKRALRLWVIEKKLILVLEILMAISTILGWSMVRGFQPDIQGLEKFMDAGFVNAILRSEWMPPADPWLSGYPLNYYYFGHFQATVLTRISGIDSAMTYNLMLASVFAMAFVGVFSVIVNVVNNIKIGVVSGILTALLLNLGGNLHTAWHFLTRQPKLYWYPDATRFIEYTIHEFPAYSFVVSDLHGHLLNLPIVLVLLTLLLLIQKTNGNKTSQVFLFIAIGFLFGVMTMTNTWDVPIYGLVFALTLSLGRLRGSSHRLGQVLLSIVRDGLIALCVSLLVSLPFLFSFRNFSKGIAIVESQSPLWQLGVLWGGFLLIALIAGWWFGWVLRSPFPLVLVGVSILLIIIPEFIYVKDIYIKEYHRANTMFKLTYQSFVILCLVFGTTLGSILDHRQLFKGPRWWLLRTASVAVLMVVFAAHMMYPFYSLRGYYNGFSQYKGIYGLQWFSLAYPDDYLALQWLKTFAQGQEVVLEAVGESYTDFARMSSFSGLPTVLGWRVHEWLWRGSFDEPSKRTEHVRQMYEQPVSDESRTLFDQYRVRYIVVGDLERRAYKIDLTGLIRLGHIAFQSGETMVIERHNDVSGLIQ